jgi:hypothetical protein
MNKEVYAALKVIINYVNEQEGLKQPSVSTHCKRGHAFTPENTRTVNGYRRCRTCEKLRIRDYRRRQRAERVNDSIIF